MSQIKNMALGVTVMLAVALVGNAQTSQKPSEDEAMIRANVEQMAKGWNTKSAAVFAKPFAENADYVVNNGMHIKNFPSAVQGLQRLFDTVEKNSVVAYTVEQIRFLRPDVAAVHVVGEMKDQANPAESGSGRITLVMTKEKGKWLIATFQNTGIRTPPAPR